MNPLTTLTSTFANVHSTLYLGMIRLTEAADAAEVLNCAATTGRVTSAAAGLHLASFQQRRKPLATSHLLPGTPTAIACAAVESPAACAVLLGHSVDLLEAAYAEGAGCGAVGGAERTKGHRTRRAFSSLRHSRALPSVHRPQRKALNTLLRRRRRRCL